MSWNLPPGCTDKHIDEAAPQGRQCEACGFGEDYCACPICPVCGLQGEPRCDCIDASFIYPPIPIRDFDWQATLKDYEPGCPIGHGRTKQDAINDLLEQIANEAEAAG
jgi:hypothetical protein